VSKPLIFGSDPSTYNYGTSVDLTTQGDPADNAGWTTLTNSGGGASKVLDYAKYYISGGTQGEGSPSVEVGNNIYLKNGNFSSNLWKLIDDTVAAKGKISVIVPVVGEIKFNQADPILGFANYIITGHEKLSDYGSKGWEKHVLHGHFEYLKTINAHEAQGQMGVIENFGVSVGGAQLVTPN
jgi:hypothetical protein